MIDESKRSQITDYVKSNLESYKAWQRSDEWDEIYKWKAVLYTLSEELEKFPEATEDNIEEIIEAYNKHHPSEGSFVRFTVFQDINSILINKKEAVSFINAIWSGDYETANDIYTRYSHKGRSMGCSAIGYLAAGRDPILKPLYRGEMYDGAITTLNIKDKTNSLADKYRLYSEIASIIAETLVPDLIADGYPDWFTKLRAVCAQDFMYHKFFGWEDNRILWALKSFIEQADGNLGKSAQDANLRTAKHKKQYDRTTITASFGQGSPARTPWLAFNFNNNHGFFPTFLYYPESKWLILAFDAKSGIDPATKWQGIDKYETVSEFFANKNIKDEYINKYGKSRVFKAYDTSQNLPDDLVDDVKKILSIYKEQAMAESNELTSLTKMVEDFIAKNPSFIDELSPTQAEVDESITEFQSKFSPEKLGQMSDDEILRYIPFNVDSKNDTMSYYLAFDSVLRQLGGIRSPSPGNLGQYQGRDGQWKDYMNKPVSKSDVLKRRKRDIELLSIGYDLLSKGDYEGLRSFRETLTDPQDNWFYSLVWVRKYFAIILPEKFIQIYGNTKILDKLESISGIGPLQSEDHVDWYQGAAKIAEVSKKLGISTYALSEIIWRYILDEKDIQEADSISVTQKISSLNTILYGPPGTGKTWSAINIYAKNLLGHQAGQEMSAEEVLADSIKDLKWWQVIALAIYDIGKPCKVTEIAEHQLIRSFARYVRFRDTKVNPTIWAILQERSGDESSSIATKVHGQEYFLKNDNSEWSLTSDGNQMVEQTLDDYPKQANPKTGSDWKKYYRVITFHQSYSYEEFVEGIRPNLDPENNISFEIKAGVFKEIANIAAGDPDNNYLLIIDEINRGNIAKIFGELITLLEDDKRGNMAVQLPYSQDNFTVPSNLYVIGTMNTADRSIALLDIALRRRFDFIELMPNYRLIDKEVESVHLGQLLRSINEKIAVLIDRDHQIGHSYFMKVDNKDDLHKMWYKKVLPLIQEYFYNDWEQLRGMLGGDFIDSKTVKFSGDVDIEDATMSSFKEFTPDELPDELLKLVNNDEDTDINTL